MPASRILVVSYPYPPMPTVGGNRWLAMTKYLRRAGHEVTVLTTSAFGSLPDDRERSVVRSPDLIAAPWLRWLLRRPPLPEPGQEAAVDTPPPRIVTGVVVPDPYVVTWVPRALATARRLLRAQRYDCIVTTSAYESAHLIPLALRGDRPAWIADFRDGWTFHPWKPPYPTRAQTRLDRSLERRVVQTADRVAVVERPVGDDFRDRLGVDAAYVPNGWDPELEADLGPAQGPELDPDRVSLVHTGKLSGGWGRHPGTLFEALVALRQRDPELAGRIEVVLAGRLDRHEQELIGGLELEGMVRHVGQLSRAASIDLQRRADALLMLTSPNLVWELPGKFFEYLGAERPILALAHANEAARLVEETGTGRSVPPGDVEAIAGALAGLARGELAAAYAPRDTERYVYPAPAEAMAEEMERAIAAQEGRRATA
jgi:glycosyltransferase involved in cell wall biosynthesis